MAFKTTEDTEDAIVAEINITPLTDIFLVLLIIFMISSSAMLESGLQVKLPTAKGTGVTTATSSKPIYVTISQDGSVAINEKRTPDGDLLAALKAAVDQSSDKTVIIRGDESIFLGNAVKIMDAARSAGAEKIAVATQPPGK